MFEWIKRLFCKHERHTYFQYAYNPSVIDYDNQRVCNKCGQREGKVRGNWVVIQDKPEYHRAYRIRLGGKIRKFKNEREYVGN